MAPGRASPRWSEGLGARLHRWTGVRRSEVRPVVLIVAYGFLAVTSHYILKPARNSVFLDRVGSDALPLIYVIVAVLVTGVAALYSRYVDRWSRQRLVQGTFAVLGGGLLVFRVLLVSESELVSGAFYVWGKLYPLLLVSQFWLVANLVFTPAQGRRLFGFVGLGLVLGGVAGAGVAGFWGEALGTENLVLAGALPLLGCSLLVRRLEDHIPADHSGPSPSAGLVEGIPRGALRVFRESPHLRNIAALLTVTIVVGTVIDWQFNRAIELFILDEDAKTEFFGRFFASVNLGAVAVQLLATSVVLRRFGVGTAILVLPVGVALGSVALLALPALLGAVILKGAEGTLRTSLDQSSREYLFLPVPREVKLRAKPVIDLAVYRGGTGLGGLLLLGLVNVLGASLRQTTIVTLGLVVVWIALALRTRGTFRASLRALVGVRDREIGEVVEERLDEATRRELERTAAKREDEAALAALGMLGRAFPAELGSAGARSAGPAVATALRHPDPAARRAAARLTEELGTRPEVGRLVRALGDPDLREAAGAVLRRGGPEVQLVLVRELANRDLSPDMRRRIPPLLYDRATSRTVQELVGVLPSLPPHLRHRVLKTLNRLRRNREPDLFAEIRPRALLELETGEAWAWTQAALEYGGEADRDLLRRTLDQRSREAVERGFRVLALEYPVVDLHAAFRGLGSRAPDTREHALELFELTVAGPVARRMRPLLDPAVPEGRRVEIARARTGRERRSRAEVLRDLEAGGDPLVAVLAARSSGREPDAARISALRSHLAARSFRTAVPLPYSNGSIMDILSRADFLGRTDLFGELAAEDLVVLAAVSEERRLEEGAVLFRAGEVPTAVYAVVGGRVEARRDGDVLFEVAAEEALGKLGLLDGEPSVYDAVAVEDTTLLAVDHRDFFDLLEDRFEVVRAMLRYLARAFRQLDVRPDPPPVSESTARSGPGEEDRSPRG